MWTVGLVRDCQAGRERLADNIIRGTQPASGGVTHATRAVGRFILFFLLFFFFYLFLFFFLGQSLCGWMMMDIDPTGDSFTRWTAGIRLLLVVVTVDTREQLVRCPALDSALNGNQIAGRNVASWVVVGVSSRDEHASCWAVAQTRLLAAKEAKRGQSWSLAAIWLAAGWRLAGGCGTRFVRSMQALSDASLEMKPFPSKTFPSPDSQASTAPSPLHLD